MIEPIKRYEGFKFKNRDCKNCFDISNATIDEFRDFAIKNRVWHIYANKNTLPFFDGEKYDDGWYTIVKDIPDNYIFINEYF